MENNRRKIAAGNWKMNKHYEEGRDLAKNIVDKLQPSEHVVILATPYIHLKAVSMIVKDVTNVYLAAQNCHQEESGAYTGEISAPMLKSIGVDFVILGHSERRQYFQESDELLAEKVNIALASGLAPIFCCGESLDIRESGEHLSHVTGQIEAALFHLPEETFRKVVIAYEPIWAIGTGKTATPEQAQAMHASIRQLIADKYGDATAQATSILYGGSVKPDNAKELFGQPDVDGALVGGASLKSDDFVAIVNALEA